MKDVNTIRVCFTKNKDIADIWILPVDNSTYAQMKVDIVQSYESPKYTAYICSQTEYNYKKGDLEREKEKNTATDSDSIWSGVESVARRIKNTVLEQERQEKLREEKFKQEIEQKRQVEQSRWLHLSGAEKQKELEERKEKLQSYHSQIIQEKSSKKALFILEIILSLVLMGLGIWWLLIL